jgi:hypothetical protein
MLLPLFAPSANAETRSFLGVTLVKDFAANAL